MSRLGRRLQMAGNSVTPPSGGGGTSVLALPRIPWEGANAYWAQFPKAAAYGWADPSFFPILINPSPFSSAEEIQWDKAQGINTYCGGLNEYSPWDLLASNGMSYLGTAYTDLYNGKMPANYAPWVGYLLDDETDGRMTPTDGFAYLQGLVDTYKAANDGRFMTTNYTQMTCLQDWPYKTQYINNYTDSVSLDMYWYTIPNSSYGNVYVPEVGGPTNPRSATSYGGMIRGQRAVDATDGKLQQIWAYIENLSGGPGEQFVRYIDPGELKGATMSALIGEARGIIWFNSAMSGPVNGSSYGNVIRSAQVSPDAIVTPRIQAMSDINHQITRLATVLNTQSYVWSFAANLDTMLKVKDGFAYIFAMGKNGSTPGSRTFTMPAGITGTSVTVVDESRTLTVSGGTFTDSFPFEYSYHIYKISL